MRIAFLNPSGQLGGAETALLEILAALREHRPGWVLHLVAAAHGPLVDRALALGVSSAAIDFPASVARLGEWGLRKSMSGRLQLGAGAAIAAVPALSYAAQLGRHLADLNPDIVHTNGLKMHLLGVRAAPRSARVVWHLHDYPNARPLTASLLRRAAGRCSMALANSDSVAGATRQALHAAVPVRTVYNAVDLSRFRPDGPRLDLDALAGMPALPPGGVRVGLLATFAKWKGHDVFLRALAQLPSGTPVRGYIIGDAIYQTGASQHSPAALKSLAAGLGLKHSVGFTGHVDEVPAALRSLDVVVHASVEPEPFGLVIAEAMACARPVVVSRAGGAAEIAQGGAVFHAPGDAADLAAAIGSLVERPDRRIALGREGRGTAERLFGRRRLAETLVPIYEGVAAGHRLRVAHAAQEG